MNANQPRPASLAMKETQVPRREAAVAPLEVERSVKAVSQRIAAVLRVVGIPATGIVIGVQAEGTVEEKEKAPGGDRGVALAKKTRKQQPMTPLACTPHTPLRCSTLLKCIGCKAWPHMVKAAHSGEEESSKDMVGAPSLLELLMATQEITATKEKGKATKDVEIGGRHDSSALIAHAPGPGAMNRGVNRRRLLCKRDKLPRQRRRNPTRRNSR